LDLSTSYVAAALELSVESVELHVDELLRAGGLVRLHVRDRDRERPAAVSLGEHAAPRKLVEQ
jgi:hypothetical protein